MTERVKVKEEPTQQSKRGPGSGKPGDLHEALEDSFPASDPPAVTQPIRSGAPDQGEKAGTG